MFNIKSIDKRLINTKIQLPNFNDVWLADKDTSSMLFLYTYIRINQLYIDKSYVFRVDEYVSTLYSDVYIKNNFKKKIIPSINSLFQKLNQYKLIDCTVIVKSKNDVIVLNDSNIAGEFEDGCYTLVDYSVVKKIIDTKDEIEKDRLFYFMLFLNNRARNNTGFSSFDDMGTVLGSDSTISKYLKWLKDNEVFDYYSSNHKLDENGIPKRGNTIVAKWENRELIDEIRSKDVPSKNSRIDTDQLNEKFADDIFYHKISKVLRNKYGLINNFLLLRLYKELPFGFTWKAIYKYLNATNNVEFFNASDDGEIEVNKTKVIAKIVNVAKSQQSSILQYDEDINNPDVILIGRAYEKANKSSLNSASALDNSSELESEDSWGESEQAEFYSFFRDLDESMRGSCPHEEYYYEDIEESL